MCKHICIGLGVYTHLSVCLSLSLCVSLCLSLSLSVSLSHTRTHTSSFSHCLRILAPFSLISSIILVLRLFRQTLALGLGVARLLTVSPKFTKTLVLQYQKRRRKLRPPEYRPRPAGEVAEPLRVYTAKEIETRVWEDVPFQDYLSSPDMLGDIMWNLWYVLCCNVTGLRRFLLPFNRYSPPSGCFVYARIALSCG